jgi:hypothetical protein
MDWIEIVSWVVASWLLAGMHVWPRQQRLPKPFGVFVSAIIGALAGGMFVHILRLKPHAIGGYSLSALLAALIAAEVGILLALATRSGRHQPPLTGGST